MHFQGISKPDAAPAVLMLHNQYDTKNWHARFEAAGINVSLSTNEHIRNAMSHSTKLRAAGLIVADLTDDPTPEKSLRELRDVAGELVPIIAIGKSHDLAHARQMRQQGANEYYAHPAGLDELIQTARVLMRMEHTGVTHNGRMVAIHGLRGGVGASMVAAGISSILAQRYGRSCASVDLNFNDPAIGSWLGCDEPGRLNELLNDIHRLDHTLLEQIRQSPFPQLDIYDGNGQLPRAADAADTDDLPGIRKLACLLGERHACQIWRTAPDYAARPVLLEADCCVLVSDGSLPSLRSAMTWLPWIRNNKPTLRTVIVFNQSRPHMPLNVDQFADSIGQAPDHILPYQRKLGDQIIGNVAFSQSSHVMHAPMALLTADLLDLPPPRRPWWKGGQR